jgi:hypothetical protein
MRTTVRLDDHLLSRAKAHAAKTGRTLTSLIEDALRRELQQKPAKGVRQPVRLKTFKGDGVVPGVDLEDSNALLDAMER